MEEPQETSRSCFVCGRENPVGLRAQWMSDRSAREVHGVVTVAEHFNGFPGVVHGGIVAALLDEGAVRCLAIDGSVEDLMVTLKLAVTYRRPTPTATPLTVVGRLVRHRGTRAEAESELRLPDGTVTATASVVLARPPASVAERWAAERESLR